MMWVAIAVAVVSLALCTWLRLRFSRPAADKLARAALARRARPYAEAKTGDLAKLEGVVKALDDGLVEGPMSKLPAVWLKLEVTEDRGDESFAPLATVVASRAFDVSGARIAGSFTPTDALGGSAPLGTMSSGPVVDA